MMRAVVVILAIGLILSNASVFGAQPHEPDAFVVDSGGVASSGTVVGSGASPADRPLPSFGRIPLYFIANEGQSAEEVCFYVQGADRTLYFTDSGITIALTRAREGAPQRELERYVIKIGFEGADRVRPVGRERQEAVFSYFHGRPEEWTTGCATYDKIVYRDLWPGIDLIYHGDLNALKYDLHIAAGADASRIGFTVSGACDVVHDRSGTLHIETPFGSLEDGTPTATQEIDGVSRDVPVAYALHRATAADYWSIGFELGPYDDTRDLVIDPVVFVYCGYIGGTRGENGHCIAVDAEGNSYVGGDVSSFPSSFPVTVGPDLSYNGGGMDAFVAKIAASGESLVYCGYLGGSDLEYIWGIAVDGDGSAYVAGRAFSTESDGFPVVVGPDLTHNDNSWDDAFVAKVNAAGTHLDYCGYIGGEEYDSAWGVAVNSQGNAFVVGNTKSQEYQNFPLLVGPNLIHNGGVDVFVAKVSISGGSLLYCGYIGGLSDETGFGVSVDAAGNAYVAGRTYSSEIDGFPVVTGPDLTMNGSPDGFIAKLSMSGASLVYCGYIGGSGRDFVRGLAVDADGNAFVTGSTTSSGSSFPVVVGPDLTHNGDEDAYVAKVNATGTHLDYCGFIGGANEDYGTSVDVDTLGNAYVTGAAWSSEGMGFPVLVGPDLTFNGTGLQDGFVAKVEVTGAVLEYCGYIGGAIGGDCDGIAVDEHGNAYLTGWTMSTEQDGFPVLAGPDLTYNGGSYDAFVAKVGAGWSVLVYMNGDNDLEGYALDDFLEMAGVGSSTEVRIVVQLDRHPGYDAGYGGWSDTHRFVIAKDATPVAGESVMSLGEVNMGDKASLVDFIVWASNANPDAKTALILWDHGDGWRKRGAPFKSAGYDETDDDYLLMHEVREALEEAAALGHTVDLVGFDACLMGMAEVAYEIRDCGDVMVGSEMLEPGDGWPYTPILAGLTANPAMTAEDLGDLIVDEYSLAEPSDTMSAIDLSEVDALSAAISAFAAAMTGSVSTWDLLTTVIRPSVRQYDTDGIYGDDFEHIDLHHFADLVAAEIPSGEIHDRALDVKIAVDQAVIASYGPTSDDHGLAIYFPEVDEEPSVDYNSSTILFARDGAWDEFIWWYFSLRCDTQVVSAAVGATVQFSLCAGADNADRRYILLGSVSGTGPTQLPGGYATLPLTWDALSDKIVARLNGPVFSNFQRRLDAEGSAAATLDAAKPWPTKIIGRTVHFAFACNEPWDFASNPVAIEVVQ